MRYMNGIVPYWFDVGEELLQDGYSKLVEIRHRDNNIELCCIGMLKHWLKVDDKASWNKLIDALQRVHLNTIAERIKQDISPGNVY